MTEGQELICLLHAEIYAEVMQTAHRIRSAVDRCELDFARLHRTRGELLSICSELTEMISPLLLNHGFLKKKNCFFRIHGDGLVQMVGAALDSSSIAGVYTYVYPLYEITQCILDPDTSIHYMVGLSSRNRDFLTYARSIEAIANFNNSFPFLLWQLELDLPMKAECLLLEEIVLPRLNDCTTAVDAIKFNDDPRRPNNHANSLYALSYRLRDRMYPECAEQIDQLIDNYQKCIEELQNLEVSEWMQHRKKMPDEEVRQWEDDVRTRADSLVKKLLQFRRLKTAIVDKDEPYIHQVMNDATTAIYAYLGKQNKRVNEVYPIEKYLL